MKNTLPTFHTLGIIAGLALTASAQAATLFTNADGANDYITTSGNWDNGLPDNPTSGQGTININAGYDTDLTMVDYDIIHSAGTVSRTNGLTGLNIGSGSIWLANGTAAYSGFRGLSVTAGGSYTQEAGVTGDFTNNSRDTQVTGTGSSIEIKGGTFSVGRDLIINSGADFTISGGVMTIADQILTQAFSTTFNSLNFNGGTTTADNFQLDKAGTATFGGSTAGSLTLTTGLGNGVTLDWSSGSLMELTVAGADQTFYEGLWTATTLQFNGANIGAFSDNFQVSGSTLSLVPEPGTWALVTAGLTAMVLLRRHRRSV